MIVVSLFVDCNDDVCDSCISWAFFPLSLLHYQPLLFIIVLFPTVSIFPLQGLYIVNIDVRVFFTLGL